MEKPSFNEVMDMCSRFLVYHRRQTPRQMLLAMAEAVGADEYADSYGEGDLIADFEKEVAALLGKESAVFMPSGIMAQQIAMRIWCDRRNTNHIAFHPKCHLEIHEQKGYQLLHGLHGVLVGSPDQLMTLADLEKIADPLGALLLEIPQREIGGQLHTWEDLNAIVSWARARGIPLHMDGARLWESGPYYNRPYAEIAGLFDTVYVSFYKGLGGIAGAVLAGPADFITEARVWQKRHGGTLRSLFPYVVAARMGMKSYLDRMPEYHRKALEIAEALSAFEDIEVIPNPPQTHMMHVYLRGDRERLEQAALDIAREQGLYLFYTLTPSAIPAYHKFELPVYDASLDLSREEIVAAFADLFKRASGA